MIHKFTFELKKPLFTIKEVSHESHSPISVEEHSVEIKEQTQTVHQENTIKEEQSIKDEKNNEKAINGSPIQNEKTIDENPINETFSCNMCKCFCT
jgi:hypothetical protein